METPPHPPATTPARARSVPPAVVFGSPQLSARDHSVKIPFFVAGEERGYVASEARTTSWSVHSLDSAFRELNARHHRTLYSAIRAVDLAAEIDRGTAGRPHDWPPGRDGSVADLRIAPGYENTPPRSLVEAARAASAPLSRDSRSR